MSEQFPPLKPSSEDYSSWAYRFTMLRLEEPKEVKQGWAYLAFWSVLDTKQTKYGWILFPSVN